MTSCPHPTVQEIRGNFFCDVTFKGRKKKNFWQKKKFVKKGMFGKFLSWVLKRSYFKDCIERSKNATQAFRSNSNFLLAFFFLMYVAREDTEPYLVNGWIWADIIPLIFLALGNKHINDSILPKSWTNTWICFLVSRKSTSYINKSMLHKIIKKTLDKFKEILVHDKKKKIVSDTRVTTYLFNRKYKVPESNAKSDFCS